MNPRISFVLQMSPSTSYENLEAIARNLLEGLNVLLNSEQLKCSIFLDGPMIEALYNVAKPLMFGKIQNAIRSGALEFLGGGYYDPMLPLFPEDLQMMQLELHRDYLKKVLGVEPQGYFNSSLVWEPGMADVLEHSRFDYALVTESAVQDALGRSTPVSGWFTLEDRGALIRIVPVSEVLSKAIAEDNLSWRSIAESYCRGGRSAVAFFDIPSDPTEIVNFFGRLVDFVETNEVQTRTVGFAVDQLETCGSISFLVSAGRNLGLPSTARTCRELLIRRPEINLHHKTFLNLYRRGRSVLSGKKWLEFCHALLPAMAPLFFRDLFNRSGMRSMMVRKRSNRLLITASQLLDNLTDFSGLRVDVCDYLLRGKKILFCENPESSYLLDCRIGGALRAWNYKGAKINLVNSWRDDGEPSFAFLDCLLPNVDFTPVKLEQMLYDRKHLLADPYDYRMLRTDLGTEILLDEEQGFASEERKALFRIKKVFTFQGDAAKFTVSYAIDNLAYVNTKGFFGTILELGLLSRGDVNKVLIDGKNVKWNMMEPLLYPDGQTLEIRDEKAGCVFRMAFDRPTSIFVGSIFGATSSAAPQAFQGIRVFPFWNAPFNVLDRKAFKISVSVTKR